MKIFWALALAGMLAIPGVAPAQGQTGVVPCDEHWSASLVGISFGENLEGIRQFYNGRVTLLRIDTEEPAAASFGVAIIMPDGDRQDEPMGIRCYVTWGYGFVDVANTQSSYDASEGLTLSIPTRTYDHDTGHTVSSNPIRLRLDLLEGSITSLD